MQDVMDDRLNRLAEGEESTKFRLTVKMAT